MSALNQAQTHLTASLSTSTPTSLSIRPAIGGRTASSRVLPNTTHPRISIKIPEDRIPDELRTGLEELSRNAVRGNIEIERSGRSSNGGAEQRRGSFSAGFLGFKARKENTRNLGVWPWVVIFQQAPHMPAGSLSIECSAEDFTALRENEDFEITVWYNRSIEAFRGLGHILGISRGLSTFSHPDASPSAESSQANSWAGSKDESYDEVMGDSSKSSSTSSLSGVPEHMQSQDTPTSKHSKDGGSGIRWTGNVGKDLRISEQCLFDTVGVMIDCSRNGVLKLDGVKFLLRQMALTGSNMLQLYCEDTYEIDGEPFFGYFRGPYSPKELSQIDDYAFTLGIEVIPCIQTLGHLGQMLQWPRYGTLRDTADVLLAKSEETYAFIEKMIYSISKSLRSKRIHIGMDEAHGVSEGRYRQIYGFEESTKVFTDHLRKVNEICQRAELAPMIWSDMLFCLPAKNNALSGYYDPNSVVTAELSASIPSEISTVFWDYYHTDSRPYTAKIAQHWQLVNKAPWMASGIWSWSRFWTALPFTFATVRASMKACKDPAADVKHVMTTIWGDEGNEFDLYSALPGVLYQAEHAYTKNEEVDAPLLRKKFDGITGADFDDYVYASKLDDTQPESQPIDSKTHYTPNLAKFLLWEEPFYSFLSPQYRGYDLEMHYGHVAAYLEQALSEDFSTMNMIGVPHSIHDFPANSRLRLPCLLAKILSLKCHLRERLHGAYKTGDMIELDALAGPRPESRMSRLITLVQTMHAVHRSNWFSLYKPFGWEVLDLRYGGLEARLNTMHSRLIAYLDPDNSQVTQLEELDVDLEVVYVGQGANLMLDYSRASRPQFI